MAIAQATIIAMGTNDYRRTGAMKGTGRQARERDLCRTEGKHPGRTDVSIARPLGLEVQDNEGANLVKRDALSALDRFVASKVYRLQ